MWPLQPSGATEMIYWYGISMGILFVYTIWAIITNNQMEGAK